MHCKTFELSLKRFQSGSGLTDPLHPGRQLGWAVPETSYDDGWNYVHPVRRLVLRWPKNKNKIGYAELISTLEPYEVLQLLGLPVHQTQDPNF